MTNLLKNSWQACRFRTVLHWAAAILLLLLMLLPSNLMSFSMPQEGVMLNFWWVISLSASKYGLAWVGLMMALLVQPEWKKVLASLLPILLVIGIAAWMNEHVLKPAVAEPRPSIEYLADRANGAVLEQGARAFYELSDKATRSAHLARRLNGSMGLQMPPLLREHWIEETGYSFPSGHAIAATTLSAWFMFLVICTGKRRWLLPLFWGWTVAVCYSRIILGVHRPEDVLAGALEGVLLAALAILFLTKGIKHVFEMKKS